MSSRPLKISDLAGRLLLILMLLLNALSNDLRWEKVFAPDERRRPFNYLRALPFGAKVAQFLVMFIGTHKEFALEDQLVGGFVRL